MKHLPAFAYRSARRLPSTAVSRTLKRRVPLICAASIALFASAATLQAITVVWTGANGPSVIWSDPLNWAGGLVPVANDAPTFDGTTGLLNTNDLAADTTFLGLTFNAGAGAFVLSGNRINSTGGIVNNSLNTQTVNLDLIFTSTHTLNSITGGTMVINSIISGAGGATKVGGGTVTLTHANTYTGATAVNFGTLKLDFSPAGAAATNIVSASSALQMGGGALTIAGVAGGTNTQTFASTAFNAGLNQINLIPGAGGTASLVLNNITGASNAAVRFTSTGTITVGTVTTATGGLIGAISGASGVGVNTANAGYATFGLDDFAAVSGGVIVGGNSVGGFYSNTVPTNTTNVGNLDLIANGTMTGGGAQRPANVVRYNTSTATTLTTGAGNLVTLTAILVTPNMGANNALFNGTGNWQVIRQTSPNGTQQGTIWQNNTQGFFTVSIPIIDGREGTADATAIVKAGAGTVVFSGANTHTSRTSIYEGALVVTADNNVGGANIPVVIAGGTLFGNSTFTLASTHAVTTTGLGGLAASTGNVLTVAGVIGGTGELVTGFGTLAGTGAGTANVTAILGDGRVDLTAANTYTGGTTIRGGTLSINGINALGGANYGGLTLNGGKLQYALTLTSGSDLSTGKGVILGASGGTIDTNNNAVSYANGITGSGTLTKTGANTLTLSANGTYSGGTVISGGTLKTTAAGSATGSGSVTVNNLGTLSGIGTLGGTVTLNTGGTIDPGVGVGTLTLPGLTLGFDSLLKFEFNANPANDLIAVTGSNALTINGGKMSVFSEGTSNPWNTAGTFNLISFNGTVQGTGTSALSVINPASGYNYTFGTSGSFVTLNVAVAGLITNWSQTGGGSWGTGSNWTNTSPNLIGATANLGNSITALSTVTLDGSQTVGGLTFDNANAYTVTQGTGGSLTLQKSSGSADLMVLSGSHAITAPVVLGSNVIADIATNGTLAVSGAISGARSLTKRGNGILTLGTVNSYSAGTILEVGVLQPADNGALGSGALSVTGGTLRAGAAGLVLPNAVSIASSVSASVDSNGNTVTLSGTIADTTTNGALTKTGIGTLILTGTNTYTGGTSISGGTLNAANGSAFSTGAVTFAASAALQGTGTMTLANAININTAINGTIDSNGGDLTLSGNINGSTGSLTKAGAGSLTLAGTNSFATGAGTAFNINAGSVILGGAAALSASTQPALAGGTLDLNGNSITTTNLSGTGGVITDNAGVGGTTTLTISQGSNGTYAGIFANGAARPLAITKTGTGVLSLSGQSTSTGLTLITAGALKFFGTNALSPSATITVQNAGGLQLGNGATLNSNVTAQVGAAEFLDMPDAGAVATFGGTANLAGGNNQYRLGVSGAGAVLNFNGTTNIGGAGSIVFLTRGNLVFGSTSSFTIANGLTIGRSTVAINVTLKDSAIMTAAGAGFAGGQANPSMALTIQDSAALNLGASGLDLNASTSATSLSTVNLNGGTLTSGAFFKSSVSATPLTTLNLNGGVLRAGASSATYLPAFSGLTAKVQAGGAKFDTNGFDVTVAQALIHDPALGATLDSGLAKSGAGVLSLTGINTYTGPTLITGGTVNTNADTALGDAGAGVTILNGAVLQAGGPLSTSTRAFVLGPGGGTIDTNTYAVAINAGSTVDGTSLTKTGNGTLTMNGVNTYTGATTVSGGTLSITNGSALGMTASGTTVADGATLALSGGIAVGAEAVSVTGVGVGINNGAILSAAGSNSLAGAVTLAGSSTVRVAAASLVLSGAISGAANALTKTGAGILTISGPQTYATLNANGGVTNVNSALGTGTATLNANATVNINASQTLAALNIADGVEVTFGNGLPFVGGPDKSAGFGGGVAVVPEPGSAGLLLGGAVGLLARRRRR